MPSSRRPPRTRHHLLSARRQPACDGAVPGAAGHRSRRSRGALQPRPALSAHWLLYAQESPVAGGARGLARGEVFTREGELVVSVVQEGLIRTAPDLL